MRQIKFRAWVGIMAEPFDLMTDLKQLGEQWPEGTSLMQFTGLLDKNGKEIYEGDIMFGQDSYGVSELGDDRFPVKTVVEFNDGSYNLDPKFANENMEIIGNIYQNSDLLK